MRPAWVYVTVLTKSIPPSEILRSLRGLIDDAALYLVGAGLISVGSVVLVPLYTRYLPPAEFGVYALLDITILVVVTVTLLGLTVSYLKVFAEVAPSKRGELLGSTLLTGSVAAGVGGAVCGIVVASPLGGAWLQVHDARLGVILFGTIVMENVQWSLMTDLRARRRPIVYSVAAGSRLLGIVLASFWLVVIERQAIYGIFLGRLLGDGFGTLILGLFERAVLVKLRVSRAVSEQLIRYGLPLVVAGLVGILLDATGRYALSEWSTLEQVGYYGAAIKIGGVFQVLLSQPVGLAWGGLMFQIPRLPNASAVYSKLVAYVFVLSLTVAALIAIGAPVLFAVFATSAYAPAMAVFPLILLVRGLSVMEYPSAIGIYLAGRTQEFAVIYLLGLMGSVLASLMLVPRYEVFGAVDGWLIGWIVIIGLLTVRSQQHYPLRYNWRLFVVPIVMWGLLVLGSREISSGGLLLDWRDRLILGLVFIATAAVLITHDLRLDRRTVVEGEGN